MNRSLIRGFVDAGFPYPTLLTGAVARALRKWLSAVGYSFGRCKRFDYHAPIASEVTRS